MKKKAASQDEAPLNKAQDPEEGEGSGQGGDEPGKAADAGEDDDDDGEDTEDEEEGEDMAKKGCKKSEDLTKDDLEKSLGQLEQYVADADKPTRKAQLLGKAQGGELSKAEREELFQILGGTEEQKSTLGTELTKGLEDNDTLAKALDVSDYLQEQHSELCKSLQSLGEHVEKSDSRQHEFNLLLARAVSDIGALTKSMAEAFETFGAQPARAPKSKGVNTSAAQPLEKSFGGQEAGAEFSKAEMLDAMQDLLEKSVNEGKGGVVEGVGDMGVAISKFEQFRVMSPDCHKAVEAHLKTNRTAH